MFSSPTELVLTVCNVRPKLFVYSATFVAEVVKVKKATIAQEKLISTARALRMKALILENGDYLLRKLSVGHGKNYIRRAPR